jgi:hypothetical protein
MTNLSAEEYMGAVREREGDTMASLELDDPGNGVAKVYALLALTAAVCALRETVDDLRRQLP